MIATTSGAMLAGVSEAEPDRIWFGRGGCVEEYDDGSFAVYVRGEVRGTFEPGDVASRDVLIAVVVQQGERDDVARAFRVSPATVGRVITRYKRGGFRAVADYGHKGGRGRCVAGDPSSPRASSGEDGAPGRSERGVRPAPGPRVT